MTSTDVTQTTSTMCKYWQWRIQLRQYGTACHWNKSNELWSDCMPEMAHSVSPLPGWNNSKSKVNRVKSNTKHSDNTYTSGYIQQAYCVYNNLLGLLQQISYMWAPAGQAW